MWCSVGVWKRGNRCILLGFCDVCVFRTRPELGGSCIERWPLGSEHARAPARSRTLRGQGSFVAQCVSLRVGRSWVSKVVQIAQSG